MGTRCIQPEMPLLRRLGVILIAAGLLGGLLEDAGLLVVSSLVLGAAAALMVGCLDVENNE